MSTLSDRAFGLVLGVAADRLFGDPSRFHPVAGFGSLAAALEHRLYSHDRVRGVFFTSALIGSATLAGEAAQRSVRSRPGRAALVALATWAVLGGRSLRDEALTVGRLLEEQDLPAARLQVTHLVGRDPTNLGKAEIVRATVESVAENASDAVVAPLLAGALLGLPGLLGYRAANTLDAMVGHRSARYERFGWASARLDDVLNLVPSRIAAFLAAGLAPLVGGNPGEALHAWARDAAAHPSPNAGVVEAAFAGALGVTLGGRNIYDGRIEDRPPMGTGPAPVVSDIRRAVRLADAVGWAALAISVGCAPRRRPRPGR